MNVRCMILLLGSVFLNGIPGTTFSQTEKEIVSNYRQALGKSAAQNDLHTLTLRGNFTVQKLTFPALMHYKSPNLLRVEMKFQNITFLQVSNDSLKWEYNPMEDKNVVTPVEKKAGAWQDENSSFDFVNTDLLQFKSMNHKLKLRGVETLDSLQVYVLVMTKEKKDDGPSTFYVNTKNHLLYKVEDKKGYRYFSDYVSVDGFVFPQFVLDSSPKQVLEIHFTEMEFNQPIADSLFVIPRYVFDNQAKGKSKDDEVLMRADSLYLAGRYQDASADYTQVIQRNSKNFRAYNSRGLTRIGMKSYYEAIADFNSALEIDATGSKALNNRGLAKFYLGDLAGAIQDYTGALGLDTTFTIALKNRGTAYLQSKKYDQAGQDFLKVITLSPNDGEAYYKYGVTLAQLEQYPEALLQYDLALQHNLTLADVYNHKGVSEFKLEQYEKAKQSFLLALQSTPENLQFQENYGRSLYELGDYVAAAAIFDAYLRQQQDKPEIHNLNGLCKYHEENYKGAIKDFSKSIELNGSNATYYDNRAAAKEMLEDYMGTIEDYSTSIRIYPNDPSVFYKRGMIKLLTSKKIEGCLDLATANEMKYEPAKEAILKNCN